MAVLSFIANILRMPMSFPTLRCAAQILPTILFALWPLANSGAVLLLWCAVETASGARSTCAKKNSG